MMSPAIGQTLQLEKGIPKMRPGSGRPASGAHSLHSYGSDVSISSGGGSARSHGEQNLAAKDEQRFDRMTFDSDADEENLPGGATDAARQRPQSGLSAERRPPSGRLQPLSARQRLPSATGALDPAPGSGTARPDTARSAGAQPTLPASLSPTLSDPERIPGASEADAAPRSRLVSADRGLPSDTPAADALPASEAVAEASLATGGGEAASRESAEPAGRRGSSDRPGEPATEIPLDDALAGGLGRRSSDRPLDDTAAGGLAREEATETPLDDTPAGGVTGEAAGHAGEEDSWDLAAFAQGLVDSLAREAVRQAVLLLAGTRGGAPRGGGGGGGDAG